MEILTCPLLSQDFMWYYTKEDGTIVAEYNEDLTVNKFDLKTLEDVKEYGLVGLGHKFNLNTKDNSFYILGDKIEIMVGDLLLPMQFNTKPYKHSESVAVLGEGAYFDKRREFYETSTNINSYEFGFGGVDGDIRYTVTYNLNVGEKSYIKVQIVGEVKGDLSFYVNGQLKDKFEIPKSIEEMVELNWDYRR